MPAWERLLQALEDLNANCERNEDAPSYKLLFLVMNFRSLIGSWSRSGFQFPIVLSCECSLVCWSTDLCHLCRDGTGRVSIMSLKNGMGPWPGM